MLYLTTTLALCQPTFAADGHQSEGHVGHDEKHHLGFFVGVLDTGKTDSIIGIEYEYRINKIFGVGVLYENAKDAHNGDGINSRIAALYYHPYGGWRIGLGAGKEKVGGSHPFTESLYRLGIAYAFHIGGIGIEPSINFDSVNGKSSSVYGISFVRSL